MDFLTRAYVRMREEAGQTMTEYALIMAAIAIVAIAAYQSLGGKVSNLVTNIAGDL